MALKLFTKPDSPVLCYKILATARLAGVDVVLSAVEADSESNSPVGKIPFLHTDQGIVFQSNAIARYVASLNGSNLLGANAFEAAIVDSWIEFAANEIDLPASVWVFPVLGYIPNNPAATAKAKADIRKVFEILNKHLSTRTFLVGQRITLADIVVSTSVFDLYTQVLDPSFRKAFVNVNRWFLTIVNQPAVKPVFGDVVLADKAAVPADTVEKPKEKPAKKEETPKHKKEKEQPKKAAEHDEEEEEENFEDEKPKSKNPLDFLPPSTLVMDEWKRMYSNNDTREVALPWFWSHLDAAGYSLWWCRYKYSAELDVTFKTANLIGGFLQRLDKLRKYGFGSLIIFGQDPTLTIEGAWLVRGKAIPAELAECDDFALYDWKEIDSGNELEKKLFDDFLAWDGDFAARGAVWGQEPTAIGFNQGKIFK